MKSKAPRLMQSVLGGLYRVPLHFQYLLEGVADSPFIVNNQNFHGNVIYANIVNFS